MLSREKMPAVVRTATYSLLLLLIAGLGFVARCWNLREVFVEGHVYFADGDCYSRMTRARMVSGGKAWSIRHHDFENHPQGTTPHTTAPVDWLIVGGARLIDLAMRSSDPAGQSLARKESLDVAGAFFGPVLGALACIALGVALPKTRPRSYWLPLAGAFMAAISPIVVHGTALGRPDHQALLIFLMAFALSAEVRLLGEEQRGWIVATGVSWGLALWVSLYEPLILMALTVGGLALARRRAFLSRERGVELATAAAIFLLGIAIDGWRVSIPDPATRAAFNRWSLGIFELRPLDLRSGVLWHWLGWSFPVAAAALAWRWKGPRECRFLFVILAAAFALTLWQLRWGYFLAVIFAAAVPAALAAVPQRWISCAIFFVGLWPVAAAWDAQLFPSEAEERRRFVARRENVSLRFVAEQQRARSAGPFIAPWWLSPALAYWSGQPGVAGTSHESLPGILDSARVYLAADAAAAWPILQARGVKWILADDPARVKTNSAQLLGTPIPEHTLADDLNGPVLPQPYTLSIVRERDVRHPLGGGDFFQLWRVRPDAPPVTVHGK